ncbi:MAG: hypothetical protein HY791_25985 [Deltaproteobacteria bacterium]|nr:hypothetical protein [Deltaproteobacteria bacterium]
MRPLAAILGFSCSCAIDGSVGELSKECVGCHERQRDELALARHSVAATSEVFVALRDQVAERNGAELKEFCNGCHDRPERLGDGLACVSCHAAVGNQGIENGRLILDLDGPVRVPSDRPMDSPHAVKASEFLLSSDLCGTCHDVSGPKAFEEHPYLHWSSSPAAERDVSCADCHMAPITGDPDSRDTLERRQVTHAVLGLGRSTESATELLARSIRIEAPRRVGDTVEVELESVASGHSLPDGASFLRELWVSLEVGPSHSPRYQSGALDAGGRVVGDELDPPKWLSARLFANDQEVESPAEADRVELRALEPLERRTLSYRVAAGPEDRLRACVRFRRYRTELIRGLGLLDSVAGGVSEVVCSESGP